MPDLLVSRGVVDGNGVPEEFNIINRKVIEDLSELHNNTVNLNETFLYRVHDDNTEEAGRSFLHSREKRRVRRRPAYFGGIKYKLFDMCMYVFILSLLFHTCCVWFFNNELLP